MQQNKRRYTKKRRFINETAILNLSNISLLKSESQSVELKTITPLPPISNPDNKMIYSDIY